MNKIQVLVFQTIMVFMCIASNKSIAQISTAKQLLEDVYKSYDNLKYLTFDVTYNYNTDTLYGDFTQDKLKGTYTMAGKRAYYQLGDIDFMQNEKYLVAVYHKEKFIIVSDPQQTNAGGYLPMRAQLDSLFLMASAHYDVSITTVHGTGSTHTISSIIFRATDSLVPFNSYVISFDSTAHLLQSLQYSYTGETDNSSAYETLSDSLRKSIVNVRRKKRLSINFSNYRYDNIKSNLYDINNYVFFEDNVCKPVSKYADYKVYNTRQGN